MHDITRFFLRSAALVGAAVLVAAGPPARAAVEDDFSVATTADLVALCDADPTDDNYSAAVHFCVGFGVGAFQYYTAIAAHDPGARYVCLPDPAPARDAVKAAFVAWARADATAMNEPPVESLFRYLGATYPCTAAEPSE